MEGKKLFRQYDMFNQHTFLDYLKQVKKRLGKKVIMFTDRARQHQSNKVQKYLEENKDSIRIFYFQKVHLNLMQLNNADGDGESMIC